MDKSKASQLDFKITVWSENSRLLLELERRIRTAEQSIAGGKPATKEWLFALALMLGALSDRLLLTPDGDGLGAELEVHSADINWADDENDC